MATYDAMDGSEDNTQGWKKGSGKGVEKKAMKEWTRGMQTARGRVPNRLDIIACFTSGLLMCKGLMKQAIFSLETIL